MSKPSCFCESCHEEEFHCLGGRSGGDGGVAWALCGGGDTDVGRSAGCLALAKTTDAMVGVGGAS